MPLLSQGDGVAESSNSKQRHPPIQEPPRLKRLLKGDLDNILLKALRKEPARRYASVDQLAEDIRRHLEGLPVTATPDSAYYRLNKFIRRHKTGVAASALIALALMAGVTATLWEAHVAVQQRARAERRFNDVRKLANSFLFEFDEAIKNLPGSTPARMLVVKRALEYLDGLAAEARGDRSLQLEIALAYNKVGEVQGDPMFPNLGDSKGALDSSNKALAILERLSSADPESPQVGIALAATHQEISDILNFGGDMAGAVRHSGNALQIYEALSAKLADDRKFELDRVTQTYHYANLLKSVGRLDEAASQYQRSIELSQQFIAKNPSDPDGKVHLATSLDGLGYVLQDKGDTVGALENRRKGLAIREELTSLDPNNAHYRRQLAFSHHNVGLSLTEAGETTAALAHFRKELSLFESLGAADPKDAQGRRNRSLAHKQIGDLLVRRGEINAALAQYRAALNIDRDLASADPSNSQAALDLSFSEAKVGSALGKVGQAREALALLRSGVQRQEALALKDPSHILLHNHLANSYTLLADYLLAHREKNEAIGYYRKAVAARLELSDKSPNSALNRGSLAECYLNLGKALADSSSEDALKQFGSANELLERLTTLDPGNARYRITLADSLSNTARLYARMAGENGDSSARLESWTKSQSLYQRSQKLWLALGSAGVIPPGRTHALQELNVELARCNESLTKLQKVP